MVENSVDIVGLKKELVESSLSYGYVPKSTQGNAISHFCGGKNVILQGDGLPSKFPFQGSYMRGKIATYCLQILNELDFSYPVQWQCLIVVAGRISEVIEDMQVLGNRLPKKVKVAEIYDLFKNHNCAHVAVGSIETVHLSLDLAKSELGKNVKMFVFDWGNTPIRPNSYNRKVKKTLRILECAKQPSEIHFAIFSDSKIPADVSDKLKKELPKYELMIYSSEMRCTLEGVGKHKIVNIDIYSEEWWVKLIMDAMVDLIVKYMSSGKTHHTRIVVVVTSPEVFKWVTGKLKELKIEYGELWMGMTLKQRDIVVDEFLNDDAMKLLITLDEWDRDMPTKYFESYVDCIIYEGCAKDYPRRLGWFHNVGDAISVVDRSHFQTLRHIEKERDILFERMEPGDFGNVFSTFEGQKHYVFMVDSPSEAPMDCLADTLESGVGGVSIIFVNDADTILSLFDKLWSIFDGKKTHPHITCKIEDAITIDEAFRSFWINPKGMRPSCVLVTTDDKMNDYCGNYFGSLSACVVINYDMPVQKRNYSHRFGLCKHDGVVIHLATPTDWIELFDLQKNLGVNLEMFTDAGPVGYLEETYKFGRSGMDYTVV